MPLGIRRATAADAQAVAAIVARAARIGNAAAYSADQIDRLLDGFTLSETRRRLSTREAYVALGEDGRIVGTATYHEGSVRAVFVDPDRHGDGIGRALVSVVEAAARREGRAAVEVRSSLTAIGFYAKLGYQRIRDVPDGVPTVLMEKALA
jgi:GNAT superfamily N-acetyltransferase